MRLSTYLACLKGNVKGFSENINCLFNIVVSHVNILLEAMCKMIMIWVMADFILFYYYSPYNICILSKNLAALLNTLFSSFSV